MIGMWSTHAQAYLLVFSAIVAVVFALPVFVAPLAWARIFLWNIPEDTDLVVYFGRCLATFLLILLAFTFRAGVTGEGLVFVFEFLLPLFAIMVLLHLYGAIRKIQPITETVEIGVYAALFVLTLLFFPPTGM